MSVTIRKIDLYPPGSEPSSRARTGEAIIIELPRGFSKRFEFDYDDDNFYVYTSYGLDGHIINTGPVRAIPRKRV